MRKIFTCLAVALVCAANLNAQMIENVVVQLEIDAPVTVPAGDLFIAVFLPGNASDPFGPTPPNGDLVFVGGNNGQTSNGLLASEGCGLTDLTPPELIGFPDSRFLVAGADAMGNAVIANGDAMTQDPDTGLACIVADPNGDGLNDDAEHADNAYAQQFSVASETVVESVLLGIEAATEGNNPLGVDTDGDGVGDAEPVFDGEIPVIVYFFFGSTPPTFNVNGANETPDAEFLTSISVGGGGCAFDAGDINEDNAVDLLDVAPFVDILTGAAPEVCQADINGDNAVDLLDVAPFVDILTGG